GIEVDNSKVSIQIKPSANLQSFIFSAIPWVFIVILVICIYQLANKKSNNINDFRKNIAKKSNENQPEFSFDNIGGAAQAKEELKTVIEFIQNPEYFQSLGARMPKGIILEGLPGTGKTLLAKAVASASNANFFYMSASEFVELYVGVGASRVRDLFNEAKKNLPAIIYIDELDAVGQRRNLSLSGSSQEQSNTLNQLLTELDGFESNQQIFVIASTNRVDILDAALLRPGRFDQRIVVDLPSFAERCQILDIHLQNKKVAEDVNIEDIARYTVDFSGAELANVVNKAAILAAKNKRDSIDKDLLEETTKAQGAIVPSAVNVQQLKQDISKEIVGQDAALTAIAWSVCSHYANIFSRSESGVSYGNKPNLFLYGPPGSGKTAIIKAAAKTLEVPFVEMTASGLVKEQAYMQKTLNRLLREANDDIRRAECGMVCLYGMEEITFD
ncbi:MAG: AAA family ATPase, partial [Trichodesmium sp. St19_bin1]|nr:AAA family ATPase [Trichodesmium sp. St19_bin1]